MDIETVQKRLEELLEEAEKADKKDLRIIPNTNRLLVFKEKTAEFSNLAFLYYQLTNQMGSKVVSLGEVLTKVYNDIKLNLQRKRLIADLNKDAQKAMEDISTKVIALNERFADFKKKSNELINKGDFAALNNLNNSEFKVLEEDRKKLSDEVAKSREEINHRFLELLSSKDLGWNIDADTLAKITTIIEKSDVKNNLVLVGGLCFADAAFSEEMHDLLQGIGLASENENVKLKANAVEELQKLLSENEGKEIDSSIKKYYEILDKIKEAQMAFNNAADVRAGAVIWSETLSPLIKQIPELEKDLKELAKNVNAEFLKILDMASKIATPEEKINIDKLISMINSDAKGFALVEGAFFVGVDNQSEAKELFEFLRNMLGFEKGAVKAEEPPKVLQRRAAVKEENGPSKNEDVVKAAPEVEDVKIRADIKEAMGKLLSGNANRNCAALIKEHNEALEKLKIADRGNASTSALSAEEVAKITNLRANLTELAKNADTEFLKILDNASKVASPEEKIKIDKLIGIINGDIKKFEGFALIEGAFFVSHTNENEAEELFNSLRELLGLDKKIVKEEEPPKVQRNMAVGEVKNGVSQNADEAKLSSDVDKSKIRADVKEAMEKLLDGVSNKNAVTLLKEYHDVLEEYEAVKLGIDEFSPINENFGRISLRKAELEMALTDIGGYADAEFLRILGMASKIATPEEKIKVDKLIEIVKLDGTYFTDYALVGGAFIVHLNHQSEAEELFDSLKELLGVSKKAVKDEEASKVAGKDGDLRGLIGEIKQRIKDRANAKKGSRTALFGEAKDGTMVLKDQFEDIKRYNALLGLEEILSRADGHDDKDLVSVKAFKYEVKVLREDEKAFMDLADSAFAEYNFCQEFVADDEKQQAKLKSEAEIGAEQFAKYQEGKFDGIISQKFGLYWLTSRLLKLRKKALDFLNSSSFDYHKLNPNGVSHPSEICLAEDAKEMSIINRIKKQYAKFKDKVSNFVSDIMAQKNDEGKLSPELSSRHEALAKLSNLADSACRYQKDIASVEDLRPGVHFEVYDENGHLYGGKFAEDFEVGILAQDKLAFRKNHRVAYREMYLNLYSIRALIEELDNLGDKALKKNGLHSSKVTEAKTYDNRTWVVLPEDLEKANAIIDIINIIYKANKYVDEDYIKNYGNLVDVDGMYVMSEDVDKVKAFSEKYLDDVPEEAIYNADIKEDIEELLKGNKDKKITDLFKEYKEALEKYNESADIDISSSIDFDSEKIGREFEEAEEKIRKVTKEVNKEFLKILKKANRMDSPEETKKIDELISMIKNCNKTFTELALIDDTFLVEASDEIRAEELYLSLKHLLGIGERIESEEHSEKADDEKVDVEEVILGVENEPKRRSVMKPLQAVDWIDAHIEHDAKYHDLPKPSGR